jgi:hypothetical protein
MTEPAESTEAPPRKQRELPPLMKKLVENVKQNQEN